MKRFLTFLFCLFAAPLMAQAPLQQAAKEHLINLINIDTSHPNPQEVNAARYIYKVLNKFNIDWDIYSAQKQRANLVAILKADKDYLKEHGAQEALIMLAHLDTAGVQGGWTLPPSNATLKDGRIWGLGATDAKNYAAINLAVLTHIKEQNIKLNRDIIFLFTADEEAGGAMGIKFLYETRPSLFAAGFALNEGGGLIKSESGGHKDIMFTEAASKMYMDILLTARVEAAHGAAGEQENNAIYKLSQALSLIESYNPPMRLSAFTKNFFTQIYPYQDDDAKTTISLFLNAAEEAQRQQAARIISEDAFFKTQLADTISPTILTAGAEPNTLAAEAQATLNCRLMPQTAPADFFNNLAALFENDESITLTIIEQPETPYPQPPAQTEDRLFKAIEAAVQKIYPDALTLAGLSPASNESEFLRRHGILAYGIGPVMGKAKEGPHQADENILEEHFLQQLELTLDIVLNLTQIKTTQTK